MDSRPSIFGVPDPALTALIDFHACAPATLSITVDEPAGHVAVLHVSGDIDITTAPELDNCLTDVVTRRKNLILDLRRVGFLGCSGLLLLETAAYRLHRDGACAGVVADRDIGRAMHVSGIDRVMQRYCTLDAALQDLRGSRPMQRIGYN
jgi:anti-sigma B factor antagonist